MRKLKIKIKELARIGAEAKRERALVAEHELEWWLENLTVSKCRKMQRAHLLAYAFLRGRPYRSLESRVKTAPNWTDIADCILGYLKTPEPVQNSVRLEKIKEVDKWIRGANVT
jgi:hypothetical protein